VHAELSISNQKLADLLLSGDMQKVKIAAQAIKENHIVEPALLDIGAEILLTKYSHVRGPEIDSLAWLARAVGSSENGRYYNVLLEVTDSATEKKLARHAETALDDIGDKVEVQYVAGMYELPAGLYAKETDSARDERILSLLMEGNLTSLKEGARAIVDSNAQTQELADTAAEILITYYAQAADNQIDTFAWITTALGQSASGRYVDILTEVEENGSQRKLRRYAAKALDNHPESVGEQYQKGMLGKAIPSYNY